jgi:hypothetical protein
VQQDLQKNIHTLLQGTLAKLDLVTREEFDTQTQVLRRTRSSRRPSPSWKRRSPRSFAPARRSYALADCSRSALQARIVFIFAHTHTASHNE